MRGLMLQSLRRLARMTPITPTDEVNMETYQMIEQLANTLRKDLAKEDNNPIYIDRLMESILSLELLKKFY
jgi:GTPase